MKHVIPFLLLLGLMITGCKKDNPSEPEPPATDSGSYPGKVKSINGTKWQFYYNSDGLLKQYDYSENGLINTATVTWETSQVTCNDGIGYTYVRPRNAAGYALPGNDDQQVGQNWTYNSANQVTFLNGINYYWSNGNVDSLTLGTSVTRFEYTTHPETRDMGAGYIPDLRNFPVYNLNLANLIDKITAFDAAGDTVSHRIYTYTFDSMNRVSNETVYIVSSGDTTYYSQYNYLYYE